jgi:uncharacterized repeat protein (TIGR01451 family)
MKKVVVAGLTALVLSGVAQAKEEAVSLSTNSYKEVVTLDASGAKKVVLQEAKKVVPGDFVVYKNAISNNSKKSVKNMVLNNAIPEHTEYIGESAKCEKDCDILFSIDGGKKFAKAESLMVGSGSQQRVALPCQLSLTNRHQNSYSD